MKLDDIVTFLNEHKDELHSKFGVEKIGVFGSYAKDRENEKSDIDFFVKFSKKSFKNLTQLYSYFENVFHTKIDIITEHKNMRPSLRREIENSVIYG